MHRNGPKIESSNLEVQSDATTTSVHDCCQRVRWPRNRAITSTSCGCEVHLLALRGRGSSCIPVSRTNAPGIDGPRAGIQSLLNAVTWHFRAYNNLGPCKKHYSLHLMLHYVCEYINMQLSGQMPSTSCESCIA